MVLTPKPVSGPQDFLSVFQKHRHFVFKSACSLLGNSEVADDIVQEVYLRFEKAWSQFKNDSSPSTFLYGITRNVCREHIRKEVRERKNKSLLSEFLSIFGTSSPKSEETKTDAELLSWALAQLPLRLREPILMHFYQDMDHHSIAQILKIPVGTVKSRIFQAKEKLSALINERSVK
jgi:RNA polymerase sigma-70 factor (ECF subfamily)